MPHPQEKTPEPVTDLPNPELNPLLNPTLGRNLGRWAEVYFTSPPEKRAEAVVELLRELRAQPASEQAENEPASAEYVRSNFEASEIPGAQAVQCAECGQSYSNGQRFCGMCGAPLPPEQASPEDHRLEATVVAGLARAPELRFGHIPDTGPIVPARAALRSAGDGGAEIRWLREKNLAAEGAATWSRRAPRYAPATLAVLAIGILIYAQSRPAGPQPAAVPTTRAAPEAQETWSTPAPPAPTSPAGNTRTAASRAVSVPSGGNQAVPEANRVPLSPATKGGSQLTAAPSSQPVDVSSTSNGSVELAQAEDFLNGKKVPRDSAVAAKFLWKAVGKENTSAILLLSDMYLIGDGVPKSCDQARLLLRAAARKNLPQAAQKLRNLQTSGCP